MKFSVFSFQFSGFRVQGSVFSVLDSRVLASAMPLGPFTVGFLASRGKEPRVFLKRPGFLRHTQDLRLDYPRGHTVPSYNPQSPISSSYTSLPWRPWRFNFLFQCAGLDGNPEYSLKLKNLLTADERDAPKGINAQIEEKIMVSNHPKLANPLKILSLKNQISSSLSASVPSICG